MAPVDFPKSLNFEGEHKGKGTSLKPAHEPIVVARKPLIGTVAQNVERFGTGALNVDACRIGSDVEEMRGRSGVADEGNRIYGSGVRNPTDEIWEPQVGGRWPANVALSHLPECQRVGERRVKGITGGDRPSWYPTESPSPRDRPGYADPDGLETVEAWSCVTYDDGVASARIWSSLLDSLGDCPSCHGFCDGQSHRVLGVAQALPPLRPGAVVVGTPSLRATLEGIPLRLSQSLSTGDGAARPATPASTSQSKSAPESRRGAGRGKAPDNAGKASPGRPPRDGRGSSASSNTACSVGSCERPDHSLCRSEAVQLLMAWASVQIISAQCDVAELDRQTEGKLAVTGRYRDDYELEVGKRGGGNDAVYGKFDRSLVSAPKRGNEYANERGGASRFFATFSGSDDGRVDLGPIDGYTDEEAEAMEAERRITNQPRFRYVAKASRQERTAGVGINAHPT